MRVTVETPFFAEWSRAAVLLGLGFEVAKLEQFNVPVYGVLMERSLKVKFSLPVVVKRLYDAGFVFDIIGKEIIVKSYDSGNWNDSITYHDMEKVMFQFLENMRVSVLSEYFKNKEFINSVQAAELLNVAMRQFDLVSIRKKEITNGTCIGI